MEYVYIGIFSKVFNWVFDKILDPVFQFVASLLSKTLSWLFNHVLGPLLEKILWPLIQKAFLLLLEIVAGVIYSIYAKLLLLIDNISKAFNYFVGLSDVTYNGKTMPLLEAMFQIKGLRTGFLLISCMGLMLACLLAIIAVTKSTLDLDFDNKRPISRVMSSFFKSFLQLLTVDFFVIFIVKLSGLVLKAIDQAMNAINLSGESTTLARMIFVVSSLNAAKNKEYNLGGTYSAQVGISDKVRHDFFICEEGMDYTNIDLVKKSFDLSKFDYLIGYALAIFLLLVLSACMIVFIQRMFDMMLLYLVSPLFVGMIPLDDGERFGKWRDMFIGKCFSGFGMVMTMKLYIMLCPSIIGDSLQFPGASKELSYIAKMVFLVGGAWAVLKSGNMVTTLISQSAGASEQQTSEAAMTTGLAGLSIAGSMAGGLVRFGAGKAGTAFGKASAKSKQEFEDSKYQKNDSSTSKTIPGIAEAGAASGGSSGGTGAAGGSSGAAGAAGAPAKKPAHAFRFGHDAKGNVNRKVFGLGHQNDKDGNLRKISLGLVSFKRGADGKMHVSKAKVPFLASFKKNPDTGKWQFKESKIIGLKMDHDKDGNAHLQHLGLIGLTRSQDDKGEYHMTSLFGGGIKRERDEAGNYNTTNFFGLMQKELQEDGKYHVSSLGFGAIKANRVMENGELNYSAVRILGFNVHMRDDVVEKNRNNKKK